MTEGPLEILFILSSILCCLYFILMSSFCWGWIKTSSQTINGGNFTTKVSIIIAARNEEKNIEKCINALQKQSYSKSLTEIIVIDDASEDDTNSIMQKVSVNNQNIELITIDKKSTFFGKKEAINCGISKASGTLIVTTDADCTMGEKWLETIVSSYNQNNAKMIVSPVSFHKEKTFFEKLQSLEFMALIVSSGSSIYYNKAIMCNGANLAYSKDAFNEVNGFDGINQLSTGDDVLLMYKIADKYRKGITFLKSKEAIVYTTAKTSLKEFVNQRKRWASKPFNLLNPATRSVSIIVYLFNTLLLTLAILSIFKYNIQVFQLTIFTFFLILITIKCFIDFLLLFLAGGFFGKRILLLYFLPEQILYIPYVFATGLLGMFGSYNWKGRKINE